MGRVLRWQLNIHQAYLGKFYLLNINNTRMIGQILMNLKKTIAFPYEILFEEGSVTKRLYILINGDIQLINIKIALNSSNKDESNKNNFFLQYSNIEQEIEESVNARKIFERSSSDSSRKKDS